MWILVFDIDETWVGDSQRIFHHVKRSWAEKMPDQTNSFSQTQQQLRNSPEDLIASLILSGPQARARDSVPSWGTASRPKRKDKEKEETVILELCCLSVWTLIQAATYRGFAIPRLEKLVPQRSWQQAQHRPDPSVESWLNLALWERGKASLLPGMLYKHPFPTGSCGLGVQRNAGKNFKIEKLLSFAIEPPKAFSRLWWLSLLKAAESSVLLPLLPFPPRLSRFSRVCVSAQLQKQGGSSGGYKPRDKHAQQSEFGSTGGLCYLLCVH
ncbi:Hypothetical predicted protein [Lynx pardinus]|uniref:Uncharacterized protein n=1 Tax=Lynx pardinus TaxID=191816 RepID=A0A485NLZ4_LYNPA|nr:Hypothetical predicted protein [Lynx pardinus]